MDLNGFKHTEISHLPNEMLKQCLSYLPTKILLQECRFVSKIWESTATLLCQQRDVTMKTGKCYEEPERFFETFGSSSHLPWSGIDVSLSGGYHACVINRQLADTFGEHIQLLKVIVTDFNYDNLFYMLMRMPNIQVFDIAYKHRPTLNSIAQGMAANVFSNNEVADAAILSKLPGPGVVNLPKLRKIRTLITMLQTSEANFLEFMVQNTNSRVTFFEVRSVFLPKDACEKTVQVLERIKEVELQLLYAEGTHDCWRVLAAQKRLNLRNLVIILLQASAGDPESFDSLDQFLKNSTKLTGLYFRLSSRGVSVPNPFQIPPMPSIETLEIIYRRSTPPHNSHIEINWLFLKPIKAVNFENLKTIVFQSPKNPGDTLNWIKFRNFFDMSDGKAFESVRQLVTDDFTEEDTWSVVFPNLTYLRAVVEDSEDMAYIFKNMTKLQELHLKAEIHEDVNLAIFRSFQTPRNLKDLKRLVLENMANGSNEQTKITEPSLILFTLLPPLQYLRITGTDDIPEECRTRLMDCHRTVVLEKDLTST